MTKYILSTVLILTFSFLAISQNVQDNFEGSGTLKWTGDDCTIETSRANPFKQGINTSATVLEYNDIGGLYANARFSVDNNFDLADNHTFSLKIYVPTTGLSGSQTNQISLKLQNGSQAEPWSNQTEIIKPITLDTWQTIVFDFENDNYININGGSLPPTQRTDLNRVVIQLNGENNTDKVLAYIDDFSYDGIIDVDPVYNFLVWSDEFETKGAIDDSKWFHQTKLPAGGNWYNGEIQHYTDRQENAFVSNGILNIVAKKEQFTNQGVTKSYTSARLNSKFAFTYGKVEVRALLPSGVGTWPAIWMLGKNINEDGGFWDNEGFGTKAWPACGEIDIMEHWGDNQNFVQSAMHTPASFGNTENKGGQTIPTASSDYHVYTLEWSPEKMKFAVDGVLHYTYNPKDKNAQTWPFDAEQYILLNIAIQPSIATNFSESAMKLDYVRVYQMDRSSVQNLTKTGVAKVYPNPVENALTIPFETTGQETIQIAIYNNIGQKVRSTAIEKSGFSLTLTGLEYLNSGSYILQYTSNGMPYTAKFIKH